MCHGDYIRFLVAVEADPTLRKALRRASRRLITLGDLVDFAAGHGYRFTEADIPLAMAQPVGCGAD
ncbi:putative ribosomally synthesized peptide with nif11-like leader [Azospirillum sp. OGB3]|uniref:Nif11-like leader peptide family natural product precursor n=1 Tax=Azospirillum sp. OGB3 TaxID=2587012 RepID=UPI001605D98D|nr:Nif11-like leader peptide family natural product precursor [Azospirillum sp. OGB3]MBB3266219.1 putative ribosomally synthesized peptide with nif11-like leader [Azospirillum sp. OGB3]